MNKDKFFIYFPHKKMAKWWEEGHGGEYKYHTDLVVMKGGILVDILAELLREDELVGKPARQPLVIHFALSVGVMTEGEMESYLDEVES